MRQARLASTVSNLEPTLIAMESCASAHYWGRRFEAMGPRMALIPTQHVMAFVRVNKSDAHDALATKPARMAWVVIAKGERFDINKTFSG